MTRNVVVDLDVQDNFFTIQIFPFILSSPTQLVLVGSQIHDVAALRWGGFWCCRR